jgi:hypothetical protein
MQMLAGIIRLIDSKVMAGNNDRLPLHGVREENWNGRRVEYPSSNEFPRLQAHRQQLIALSMFKTTTWLHLDAIT